MDVAGHRLVTDYLSRLHAAAWLLPAARRTALVNRTRDQLHADLGDEPSADLARAALDRLGPPEDLVQVDLAEARAGAGAGRRRPPAVWGSREVATVLLLAIGGLARAGASARWSAWRWPGSPTGGRPWTGWWPWLLVVLPLLLAALGGRALRPLAVALLVPLAGLVPAGYLALVLPAARGCPTAHEVSSEG